jgi:hypothetical protein
MRGHVLTVPPNVPTGQRMLIGWVHDGKTIRVYVNGRLIETHTAEATE